MQKTLQNWIKGNVTNCAKSLFIFDEMEAISEGFMDVLSPFLDFHPRIDGTDFRCVLLIVIKTANVLAMVVECRLVRKEPIKRKFTEMGGESCSFCVRRIYLCHTGGLCSFSCRTSGQPKSETSWSTSTREERLGKTCRWTISAKYSNLPRTTKEVIIFGVIVEFFGFAVSVTVVSASFRRPEAVNINREASGRLLLSIPAARAPARSPVHRVRI